MNPEHQADPETAVNSLPQIRVRLAERRVTWMGPLLVVTGRSGLILVAQALVCGDLLSARQTQTLACRCALVDCICHSGGFGVPDPDVEVHADRANHASQPDRLHSIAVRARLLPRHGNLACGVPAFCGGRPSQRSLAVWHLARGPVPRLSHQARFAFAGSDLYAQLVVVDLVAYRGNDLPGLRAAPD